MEKTAEKERKSKRVMTAEDGCLNSAFTLNKWFVKVRPCYGIGKVCFSFVMKTSNPKEKGKISFDVYMEMDTFDNWCDDILDRTMESRISYERKNNCDKPYYTFTTGENGAYTVKFCFSTVSDVNISGKGKHKENGTQTGNFLFANVPVTYDWLRTLAKYYKRTSESWFAKIADTILEASSKKGSYQNDDYADETNTFDAEGTQERQIDEKTDDAGKNTMNDKKINGEANNEPQGQQDKSTAGGTTKEESKLRKTTLYTTTCITEREEHKGDYKLQATEKPLSNGNIAEDAHVFNVIVTNDVVKQIGNAWIDFAERTKKSSVKIIICYITGTEEIKGKTYNVVYVQNLAF